MQRRYCQRRFFTSFLWSGHRLEIGLMDSPTHSVYMPPCLSAQADGVMLSAMQALARSEGLRNGTLADWEANNKYLYTLTDCIATGQAPDKALRNKDAWSKAVDKCITAVLDCYPSAFQAAIYRSDPALLTSIGQSLAHCLGIAHCCLNSRPAWLRLQEQPYGLQQSVEALVLVMQPVKRLAASAPMQSEHVLLRGLAAAISLNNSVPISQRLGEGLLVDLHCAHLKVSYPCTLYTPCMHGCLSADVWL